MRWCVLLLLALPAAQAVPIGVHVGLLGDPPAAGAGAEVSDLVFAWSIDGGYLPTVEPQVQVTRADGTVQVLDAEAVGGTQRAAPNYGALPDEYVQAGVVTYAARLAVAPGEAVDYQVGADGDGWSETFTVHRPPAADATMRVLVMGDIGPGPVDEEDVAAADAILEVAMDYAQSADLLLIPGDLAYFEDDTGWNAWMERMEPLMARVVTMTVPGNHEFGGSQLGYDLYKARFVNPQHIAQYPAGGERPIEGGSLAEEAYAFTAGPVYFIGLNSDRACAKGPISGGPGEGTPVCPRAGPETRQIDYLANALAAADGPWVIPFFHHPPYSRSSHGDDLPTQTLWAPLMEAAGVDLVLTAHDHSYQRTHVMEGGALVAASERDYVADEGAVYIVNGGGGRPMYGMEDPPYPDWLAAWDGENHTVLVLDISPDRIDGQAVGVDRTLDTFSIVRGSATPPLSEASPAFAAWVPLVLVFAWVAARRYRSSL